MWFERNVMYSVCIYDLSVLAVSRMGLQQQQKFGLFELYPIFFWIFGIFFNFAKPLSIKK